MIRRPPRSTPFPTRRSSDLPLVSIQTLRWVSELVATEDVWNLFSAAVALKGFHTDRKSTRLNSSHTVISYAVFCLKKKKKKKKYKKDINTKKIKKNKCRK